MEELRREGFASGFFFGNGFANDLLRMHLYDFYHPLPGAETFRLMCNGFPTSIPLDPWSL